MHITVLGTGLMGAPVAIRLAEQGFTVTAWNRSAERAIERLGGRVPFEPDQRVAMTPPDVLLLFLSDAAAIEHVLFGPHAAPLSGKAIIQMGTIAPQQSRDLQARCQAAGGDYLEAPVLGSIPEAREGRLLIMVGGREDQFERFRPLFTALGPDPRLIGPVGRAAALKLALNQLIAGLTASFALSLGFVQKEGVAVDDFMDILRQSALYAPTFDKKLGKMLDHHYANPNFPLQHLLKDVRLFLDAARDDGLCAESLKGIERVLARALRGGHGRDDYSALFEAVTTACPASPPTEED